MLAAQAYTGVAARGARAPFTSLPPRPTSSSSRAALAAAAQLNGIGAAAAGSSAAALRMQHAAPMRRRAGRFSGASVVVRASWGAPVEWQTAKVLNNSRVADKLRLLVVDIGAERAAGYTKPGQFVQVKVGDTKPGFFAIASAPDPNNQGALELLIKAQGETAEALVTLAAGAEVEASPVMGKGFAVDTLPPSDVPEVFLFATGSGISPIKALIESGALQADQRQGVHLFYGTRDAGSTAFADQIPAWERAGVKVTQVLSSQDGKYVQDVFAANKGIKDAAGVGVVLCGHKDMCNAIKEIVGAEGVAAERVLLNF